jgi:hypothetical protein
MKFLGALVALVYVCVAVLCLPTCKAHQAAPSRPDPEPSGLILLGHVIKWDPPQEDGDTITLTAHIGMEFMNKGSRPALVLKTELTGDNEYWLRSASLLGTPVAGGADVLLWDCSARLNINVNEFWHDLEATLRKAATTQEDFFVIGPGEPHFFEAKAELVFARMHPPFFVGEPSWSELQVETRKFARVRLEVAITIWPGNPKLGRELRSRWSKVGVLELGEDGIITSEPIPIQLPSIPTQLLSMPQ